MPATVPIVAAVLATAAALVHVYIFVLESLRWTAPRTRATFGVATEAEALVTRELAYNQGWYNLFLAIGTVAGLVLSHSSVDATRAAGVGVLLFATGSMVAAALVLVIRRPALARAATVQGLLPLLAVVLTVAVG
jgi:putative membrane protein